MAGQCRPAPAAPPAPGNPIPSGSGAAAAGASPLRYVIYVVKENRTYDEVFGDMPEGNGDPSLCLFPEKIDAQPPPPRPAVRPPRQLLRERGDQRERARMEHGGYSSEFVEKTWPPNYGHKRGNVPYPAEGRYAAAVPALGYLWDRARAAGITYRDYGEFVGGAATPESPSRGNLPALRRPRRPPLPRLGPHLQRPRPRGAVHRRAAPLRGGRRDAPPADRAAAKRPHGGGQGGKADPARHGGAKRPRGRARGRGRQPFALLAPDGDLHRGGRRPERPRPRRRAPHRGACREPLCPARRRRFHRLHHLFDARDDRARPGPRADVAVRRLRGPHAGELPGVGRPGPLRGRAQRGARSRRGTRQRNPGGRACRRGSTSAARTPSRSRPSTGRFGRRCAGRTHRCPPRYAPRSCGRCPRPIRTPTEGAPRLRPPAPPRCPGRSGTEAPPRIRIFPPGARIAATPR